MPGSYHIERRIGLTGNWVEINTDDASPYLDAYSFIAGETYYYRIRQYINGAYTAYSNTAYLTYGSVTGELATLKFYDGSTWHIIPLKYYNGSDFIAIPIIRYNL